MTNKLLTDLLTCNYVSNNSQQRTRTCRRTWALSCPHKWNKTEVKQKYNNLFQPKQNANHSRYPLFMAWRATSGYIL